MKHTYKDGKIIIRDNYYNDAVYHVSNECVSVIFDGKGATCGYALANEADMLHGSIALYRHNAHIDIYSEKTVEMIGRCQTITVNLTGAELMITQFMDVSLNGVFASYELLLYPQVRGFLFPNLGLLAVPLATAMRNAQVQY